MSAWKVARVGFGVGKVALPVIAVVTDWANVMRVLTLFDILRTAIARAAIGHLRKASMDPALCRVDIEDSCPCGAGVDFGRGRISTLLDARRDRHDDPHESP